MSTKDTGIRTSADANCQQESQANESPEQQQTCRTADANHHQESWAIESREQQQNHRRGNAN